MPKGKPEQAKQSINSAVIMRQVNIYAYRFFNIIIIIAVLLVFFLSFQFSLKPKYSAILNEDEIHQKQEEYTQKMKYLMQLSQLKGTFDKILQDDKDKINAIVSNTNEKEDLFKEMDYLAERENLSLESLDVLPLEDSYSLENLAENNKRSRLFDQMMVVRTIVVLKDVSYEGLINALKTIEVNLRIMDVRRVEYDPLNRMATIELLTYQLK
ncbi:MAG: hypothetical protein ABIG10_02545 [bacterium]